MATAKKSSTKKTATKKKVATTKTTNKKTIAKKPDSKKAVASKKVLSKKVTLQKLYKFNLFMAVASALFAVLSIFFISSEKVKFLWSYSTKDQLASVDATVLAPAYDFIASVEIRYILAGIFGLGAILSLLLATSLRSKYEAGVTGRVSSLRWLFIGIISALTLELVSILGGVQDITILKLIAGLVLITSLLGWISERQNRLGEKTYSVFYIALFAGFLAWLPLLSGLAGTAVYGIQSFGWHVYALAGVVLIGFIAFALNQYRFIKNGATNDTYLDVEGKYLSTDFMIRLATFAIIVIALYK